MLLVLYCLFDCFIIHLSPCASSGQAQISYYLGGKIRVQKYFKAEGLN